MQVHGVQCPDKGGAERGFRRSSAGGNEKQRKAQKRADGQRRGIRLQLPVDLSILEYINNNVEGPSDYNGRKLPFRGAERAAGRYQASRAEEDTKKRQAAGQSSSPGASQT